MKLYFTSILNTAHWGGIVYQLTMSDNYIPLWKKAGIYNLLYKKDGITCALAIPELTEALTEMCIHYLDYRNGVKLPPSKDKDGGFMDELLREQTFRQAVAVLAMLIESANLYPPACLIRRVKEEVNQ